MKRIARSVLSLAIAGLLVAGCNQGTASVTHEEAIHIEEQDDGLKKMTLSEKAAQRLGVETVPVAGSGSALTVPYAAVIYDAQGKTWSYVNTEPLTYMRAEITITEIEGETARLSAGPPAGTPIVTTGSAELYGAETGVGGGH
jgi:hypothetical protein